MHCAQVLNHNQYIQCKKSSHRHLAFHQRSRCSTIFEWNFPCVSGLLEYVKGNECSLWLEVTPPTRHVWQAVCTCSSLASCRHVESWSSVGSSQSFNKQSDCVPVEVRPDYRACLTQDHTGWANVLSASILRFQAGPVEIEKHSGEKEQNIWLYLWITDTQSKYRC